VTIAIAPALLSRLLAEAAATPTLEICGLLFGTPDRIDAAQRTHNVAADPSAWFEVDPAALFAALRAERAGGAALIGHYHSHPNGRAVPSPRDLAAAEPGRLWLIIGGGVARAWRAQAADFREIAILTDR
jgi:proteasome lid subunit RPN8/RPN11